MFGLGFQELLVIFVVALLVFGPKRLPELARSLGKSLNEFRRASNDLRRSVMEEPPAQPAPPRGPAEEAAATPLPPHAGAAAPSPTPAARSATPGDPST